MTTPNKALTLDVIIPCYNAQKTLFRAVQSVLLQPEVQNIYLIDDHSTDDTWLLIQQLMQQFPQIKGCRMPYNCGAAMSRNWGAMQSTAEIIAFLDADDAYQKEALSAAMLSFQQFPTLALLRLALKAVDFPQRYTQHPDFATVWHILQMTVASNMVFRRSLFLAAGGFPTDDLFKRFGGEDVALGNAFNAATLVGTIFSDNPPGVLHFYHNNIHAQKVLDAGLFGIKAIEAQQHIPQAEQITVTITTRLMQLSDIVTGKKGVMPIYLQYENDE